MLWIKPHISIPLSEIEMTAIRAQGPGGQNVNKVATAIHLRFDVKASSLLSGHKTRILAHSDNHIAPSGIIVIKAQSHRTQERNKQDALDRLQAIVQAALKTQKPRRPTRPSQGAIKRRLKKKAERSSTKSARGRVKDWD